MGQEDDAYFNTEEGRRAQLAVENEIVEYHSDLLKYLEIDIGRIQDKKYLDVGCARGKLMEYFRGNGFDVYGCDISKWAVRESRKNFKPDHIMLVDVSENEPFSEKFSLITCFGVLGLVDREKHVKFLRNCFEMLDEGGVFVATAPNAERPAIIKKMLKKEKSYGRARTAGEWFGILQKFSWDIRVETIQRLPLSKKWAGKNIFIKTRFGDPIVLFGEKLPPAKTRD